MSSIRVRELNLGLGTGANSVGNLYIYQPPQNNTEFNIARLKPLADDTLPPEVEDNLMTFNLETGVISFSQVINASINGNSSSANSLSTGRLINGTSFNGTANITTANWGTARTLTIGSAGKSVNGSGNVAWTLAEIGAAATTHSHTIAWSGGTTAGPTLSVQGGAAVAIPSASGTASGAVTTGPQTFEGDKTFLKTISGSIDGNAATVTGGVYTSGDQTIDGTKTFSNAVVLSTQASTTGHAVRADRTITISGTANQVTVSAGAQNLTANRTWTISLPQDIHTAATPTFGATTIDGTLGVRSSASSSTATQFPVFTANPASITRILVTRTPAQVLGDIGAAAATHTHAAGDITSGTLEVSRGGTGQTSYVNGELLIGNTTGNTLTKATLTGTSNRIIITNGNGSITINADATNANTANKIVARDANGNFSAGTITASLSGNATTATTANNLKSNATTGVMQIVGPAAGNTPVMTIPNENFTAARTDAAQTFTGNQTITGNLILGTQASKATITYATNTARTLTIPNVGGNRTFAFINEAQTFTGEQTFSSTIKGSIDGTAENVTGTVAVANGGTGQTSYTNGQLLIGNTTGNTLTKATLTAGSNVTITNGAGSISIAATSTTYSAGNGISLSGTTFSVAAGTGLTQDTSGLSLTAITAGNATVGALRYNTTTRTAGQMYGGTTAPSSNTRLNYDGHLYATQLFASENITAYFSDDRLKNKLGRISSPVDKVKTLNGFYYTENELAKSFGYKNDRVQVGVSAQEVNKVLPEAVADAPINSGIDGADYKTVHYEKLIPLLIEAIKELSLEVERLKNS